MANNHFASVPNISIPRSRFKQPFNHSTTFNHGQLVPVDCFDILPGDTYAIDLASLIWMSNPIRPIFGNITAHVDVFFVPMRLVWDKTKEFFGENKVTSGYQTGSYKIPCDRLGRADINVDSLSHYLGKPLVSDQAVYPDGDEVYVSVLKERGYYEIWNNYYRAQQIQSPVIINYGGNGVTISNPIGTLSGTTLSFASGLLNVNKEFDYFTAATLYPQYGPAVTLPLGTFAPVITQPITQLADVDPAVIAGAKVNGSGLKFISRANDPILISGGNTTQSRPLYFSGAGEVVKAGAVENTDLTSTGYQVVPANLAADLSQATAATINSLRYAFAVQKFLERSNFGSRFFEMLSVHYGVTSPDATLQIPQRIGHADFPINISTVLSTAGATDDTSTALGMPGASSCTATKKFLCTHAFTEPGFLYVLLSTTHERSYTRGVLREDMKLDRYEIYSPEFANLGDQEIKNCEIYLGTDGYNHDVFGYQEHWAEYRYRPHRVSGVLDPAYLNALDMWVLTDDYNTRPTLSPTWLQEDRAALTRCLVSGDSGPDYIADFYLPYIATREMPLFTIPGLIDHFGTR